MTQMKRPTGIVLYEGPSRIDGAPIVAIATLETKNGKTGDMIQTWIMRADIEPVDAIVTGEDSSICGSCPLRGLAAAGRIRNRGCYVQVYQAPLAVYRAWQRGSYPQFDQAAHGRYFIGRGLRLGAYGDPVAAPYSVWRALTQLADGHTGYTHQWRDGRFWRFRSLLMASTHSIEESEEARGRGWRTFRTSIDGAPAADEIICPASAEAGYRRTCDTCRACNGGSIGKRSVVIALHGSKATVSGAKHSLAAV